MHTGTGPEGHARLPTSADHDYRLTVGPEADPAGVADSSLESWSKTRAAAFATSRTAWRAALGPKDEGEWVGEWTMCVRAKPPSPAQLPLLQQGAFLNFNVTVALSRCPIGLGHRECSGRGTCART